jgi:hypothetical protein
MLDFLSAVLVSLAGWIRICHVLVKLYLGASPKYLGVRIGICCYDAALAFLSTISGR